MTLADTTRQIQRIVGAPADGKWGPVSATATLRALQKGAPPPAQATQGPSQPVSPPSGQQAQPEGVFDKALAVILRHEGGFVNHPRDPGGMTNLGVTKATWESWTGKKASESDMRALTPEKVAPLYRKNYWDRLRCDDLPPALALCVFDFGVNAGPARAARFLQRLAGSAQDGIVGPATIAAAKAWFDRIGGPTAVMAYQDARRDYYRSLSTFATFGRGWLRRVDETEAEARKLL